MKKALMLGSAAVAMAAIATPIAALDIDFSGRSRFNIDAGDSFADPTFSNDERLDVNVSASTCCLSYGGKLRIEDGGVSSNIYLSGDFGKLDFGNIETAKGGVYDTSVLDAGPLSPGTGDFDGINYGGTGIVYTAPVMAGFTGKLATDGDKVHGSLAGSLGPVGIKLGAGDDGVTGAQATYSTGDLGLAVFTGEDDDGDSYTGGALSYSLGAIGLSLSATEYDLGLTTGEDVVAGAKYTIASGLTASAAIADRNGIVDYRARLQLDF